MENYTTNWTPNFTVDGMNVTTTMASSQNRAGPPPIGYYGETRKILWKVITPIIISWGTVGNVLTLLVLFRNRKISSTAMFLVALAMSDLVILYSGPLRNWINFMWEVDIRYLSDAGCRVQVYLTYCSIHFSSWILVAVTWERTLSVLRPHKVRLFCTSKRAAFYILGILIFILGFNMVIPITFRLNGLNRAKCSPYTVEYKKFRDDIFLWMDLAMAFAVPCALLLIGNGIIVVQLYRSRAQQRKMAVRSGNRGSSTRDTKSVSVLMISLCVIFLLTMTPVSVILIDFTRWMDNVRLLYKIDPIAAWEAYQYLLFIHTVINLIGYTNASFNFILYVFSGAKFRLELLRLFQCKKPSDQCAFSSKRTSSSSRKNTSATVVKNSDLYHIGGENSRAGSQKRLSKGFGGEGKKLMPVENMSFETEE